MSDFYQEIFPEQEHLYFSENMRKLIKETVQQQIVAIEVKNLAEGQGIFVLDELTTKERGRFHIAIHVIWRYDIANKQFIHFQTVKYHLYSGDDIPDELLDEINELQAKGTAEWKHPT